MKLLVATDLHGSAYWAQRVVDVFNASGADMLVLLGDVYNHGPRNPFPRDYAPLRAAEILNSVADRIVAVKGNCDSDVDEMISRFPFVQQDILPLAGRRIMFTHGHVYNKNSLPKLSAGDVLVYGHFHICEIVEADGIVCVNVGSAALPKDASCYCLVDEGGVTLLDFDGNAIAQKTFR